MHVIYVCTNVCISLYCICMYYACMYMYAACIYACIIHTHMMHVGPCVLNNCLIQLHFNFFNGLLRGPVPLDLPLVRMHMGNCNLTMADSKL